MVGHPVESEDAGEWDEQVEGGDHHEVEAENCRDLRLCPHRGHKAAHNVSWNLCIEKHHDKESGAGR